MPATKPFESISATKPFESMSATKPSESMSAMSRKILCINDHIAELDEVQTERLIASLPQWRRQEALRFRHLQGKRECAVGYVELLRGLRLLFDINGMPEFSFNEHGKPFLAEHPDVHFSISHCSQAVGCLLSDRPCGLDIERIRPVKEGLVRYTMNAAEAEAVFAAPCPELMFTRLWTQKEAVLKLLGTGITDDLHHVLDHDCIRNINLQTIENPLRGYVLTTAIA